MEPRRSSLVNRNVTVAGRRTSVRLEPEMWVALTDICRRERLSLNEACTLAGARRGAGGLTAAIRVFIMTYYRDIAADVQPASSPDEPE